ncbi:MAG: hypothetical protein V1753_10195, partial [Pseudomonadota bacterium]
VSFESAKWRDEFFVKKIKGDHLNEVGWWHPWAAQAIGSRNEFEKHIPLFYLGIAQRLANKGV